ncbi:MAG: phosphatidylserine decarboxylase [Candidatus Woesearchaeota archaeon]
MILNFLLILLIVLIALTIIWKYALFYRDPKRNIPAGNNLVSPADGTVVYIKKFSNGKVPNPNKNGKEIKLEEITHIKNNIKKGYIIGIFMNPLSVHVNRAPISGKIEFIKHTTHKNKSMLIILIKVIFHKLSRPGQYNYELENERNTILIMGKVKNKLFPVYIIQIADTVVKKVVCWMKKGDLVNKGQKIGMIKMGSQVDLILPDKIGKKPIQLRIKESDYVYSGSSAIAEL